jgi:hypothetical protein
MYHALELREMYRGIWWENMKDRDHLKDLEVDEIILVWIFNK